MSLDLITGPATEPVSLAEIKQHCRVDADLAADDALLGALISAARERCEHELGSVLITQTWERVLDAFPASGDILLGKPPVQSIASIKYLDTSGVERTFGAGNYLLSAGNGGWAILANGAAWPDTADTADAVRVRFVAGHQNAAAVPESIKLWIRLHVGEWYATREAASDKPRTLLEYAAGLLDRYREWARFC